MTKTLSKSRSALLLNFKLKTKMCWCTPIHNQDFNKRDWLYIGKQFEGKHTHTHTETYLAIVSSMSCCTKQIKVITPRRSSVPECCCILVNLQVARHTRWNEAGHPSPEVRHLIPIRIHILNRWAMSIFRGNVHQYFQSVGTGTGTSRMAKRKTRLGQTM